VEKRAPWPAPEEGSARCPLAMSEEELSSFICDNGVKFFDLASEPPAEDEEEKYWCWVRGIVEEVRQARAALPDTAQLAMSADEIVEYFRRAQPQSETERERAIKFVLRLKPGGPRKEDSNALYLNFWKACMNAKRANVDAAKKKFLGDGPKQPPRGIGRGTAAL
jgi:hypothetical protein